MSEFFERSVAEHCRLWAFLGAERNDYELPWLQHIRECEAELDLKLPEELIEYFLEVGNAVLGRLQAVTVRDLDASTDLRLVIREWRDRGLPHDHIPLAITEDALHCWVPGGLVELWPSEDGDFFDIRKWLDDAPFRFGGLSE